MTTQEEEPGEQTPLLPQTTTKPHRLRTYFTQRLSTKNSSIPLLFCYIITGLLDSSSIHTYGTFVSMQTGTFPSSHPSNPI